MRAVYLALCSLLLTACATNPATLYEEQVKNSKTPLAQTPLEALRSSKPVQMPVDPGWRPPHWAITAAEPRLLINGKPSNYRVFSTTLAKDKAFHINVNSWCVNACLGFSKYVLNPYLILMDDQGSVLAEGFGKATGTVGVINQALTGTVKDTGTYYLIVAADNRSPGENVIMSSVMVVGAPIAPVVPLRIGMSSYPFGSIGPFLTTDD